MSAPTEGIPTPVQSLIFDAIGSVEQLEVVMLLRKHPDSKFRRQELARKLRSSDSSMEITLKSLCSHGLIQCDGDGTYSYLPGSDDKEETMQALIELYKSRRTTVIQTIYNKP
jgi:hypothetical protein